MSDDVKTTATDTDPVTGTDTTRPAEAKDAAGTVLHLAAPDAGTRPLQPAHESAEGDRARHARQEADQPRSALIGPRAE